MVLTSVDAGDKRGLTSRDGAGAGYRILQAGRNHQCSVPGVRSTRQRGSSAHTALPAFPLLCACMQQLLLACRVGSSHLLAPLPMDAECGAGRQHGWAGWAGSGARDGGCCLLCDPFSLPALGRHGRWQLPCSGVVPPVPGLAVSHPTGCRGMMAGLGSGGHPRNRGVACVTMRPFVVPHSSPDKWGPLRGRLRAYPQVSWWLQYILAVAKYDVPGWHRCRALGGPPKASHRWLGARL